MLRRCCAQQTVNDGQWASGAGNKGAPTMRDLRIDSKNAPRKNPGKSVSSQSVRVIRRAVSTTPWIALRNSPSVRTLRCRVVAGLRKNHSTTAGSGSLRRSSDKTLVSSK